MGLLFLRLRFHGDPPTEDIVRAELHHRLGSAAGLDGFEVNDNVVDVTTAVDPVTNAYVLKILLDMGGEQIDPVTRQRREPRLPEFVQRPWREWPWWKRARIRLGTHSM
jgi:hypothetical protein